jgi:transposase-like protein
MPNELKLAVKCPACRHTRLQSLRQIKSQAKFTCQECGYQVALRENTRQSNRRLSQPDTEIAHAV